MHLRALCSPCWRCFFASGTRPNRVGGSSRRARVAEIEQFQPQEQAERVARAGDQPVTKARSTKSICGSRPGRGRLTYSKQFQSLIDIAYNSSDLRVRAASIELTLVAYKVAKDPAAARRMGERIRTMPKERPWRLWVIGLLANRGVETEEGMRILLQYVHDPDEDTRLWAVNSLAVVGSEDIIDPCSKCWAAIRRWPCVSAPVAGSPRAG